MTDGDLITAQEAAKLLRLHVKRVQRLARHGKLPPVRYGRDAGRRCTVGRQAAELIVDVYNFGTC